MFFFVVDGSTELGFGHLIRCLNLARLNRQNNPAIFVVKPDKAALTLIKKNNFSVVTSYNLNHWPQRPDLVFFDIAQQSNEYKALAAQLSQKSIPFLQITDLGLNLLNQATIVDGSVFTYPETSEFVFSGPQYMILHHKNRHFHKLNRHYRQHINNVLISLGGTTPYRQLRYLINALFKNRYRCTIAPGFVLKKNQKKILSRLYPTIKWVGITESLARSMFECDLALLAPGVAAYEAACTGTPAIYLSHHQLQNKTATLLAEKGIGLNLGLLDQINPNTLIKQIIGLTQAQRSDMGQKGKHLVDGLGLYRVNQIAHSAVISYDITGVTS